jgi:hypothetical protein
LTLTPNLGLESWVYFLNVLRGGVANHLKNLRVFRVLRG